MEDVARQDALRKVALLTEGVYRNICSPKVPNILRVALLTEGVDRNCWCGLAFRLVGGVALLTEGVDRNIFLPVWDFRSFGRPPHGGRG